VVGKPRLQYNGHDTRTANSFWRTPASSVLKASCPKRLTHPMRQEIAAYGGKPKRSIAGSSWSGKPLDNQPQGLGARHLNGAGVIDGSRRRRFAMQTTPPNPIMRLLHSWNSKMCRDETAGNREVVPVVQYLQPVRLGSARPVVGVDEMGHGLKAEEIRGGRRREEDVGR
jgi:hypothetical protein